MSEEQLKAFLEKVKADTSLQEKLKAASDSDAVAAIAKEAGFSISADDLTKDQSELSDAELEGVTGGMGWISAGWLECLTRVVDGTNKAFPEDKYKL
ncbi:Nif11-like leader peptide family natural product precursor [Synechococcus sp. AH-551-B05]|nr:Nif11-like leader peptide family natural product precursor [Synechococcus sp. AH-551-B05]MDB4677229.1 Nif11-like leader peptide family natural product precursor [Synechococcus sp. AH-551-B05]